MKKKFAIVFLSLFLVVSLPFAAHANIVTATGKYLINAVKKIPGGAKVEATNTVTGAKHVINHGVSSGALGGAIGAGIVSVGIGSGVGLAFQAITGLALDAVDWVMDPANNQIKWKEKGEGTGGSLDPTHPSNRIYYRAYLSTSTGTIEAFSSLSNEEAADKVCALAGGNVVSAIVGNQGSLSCTGNGVNLSGGYALIFNPNYDPSASPESDFYKSLPLVDLAKKTLELADGGEVLSQKDIEDYVTHLAKEGELDDDLDNATDITKPEGTEPEPEPPIKCPAGTVNIEGVCIPKSDTDESLWCNSTDFSKKICDWIDWTQVKHDVPEPDAGKVDVTDKSKDLNIDQNRIDFTNQCPAPTPINTSVGGFPVSTELNYQPLCDFFTMLNPFVIGMGGISSALIIAGGVRRG